MPAVSLIWALYISCVIVIDVFLCHISVVSVYVTLRYRATSVADPEGAGGHAPQTIRIQHAKISDNIVNTKYSMQTLPTTVCFT